MIFTRHPTYFTGLATNIGYLPSQPFRRNVSKKTAVSRVPKSDLFNSDEPARVRTRTALFRRQRSSDTEAGAGQANGYDVVGYLTHESAPASRFLCRLCSPAPAPVAYAPRLAVMSSARSPPSPLQSRLVPHFFVQASRKFSLSFSPPAVPVAGNSGVDRSLSPAPARGRLSRAAATNAGWRARIMSKLVKAYVNGRFGDRHGARIISDGGERRFALSAHCACAVATPRASLPNLLARAASADVQGKLFFARRLVTSLRL